MEKIFAVTYNNPKQLHLRRVIVHPRITWQVSVSEKNSWGEREVVLKCVKIIIQITLLCKLEWTLTRILSLHGKNHIFTDSLYCKRYDFFRMWRYQWCLVCWRVCNVSMLNEPISRNIFGSSSTIFGKVRKMFGNGRMTLNIRKMAGNLRKIFQN